MYANYGKLYQLCGNPRNSLNSDKHFIKPGSSVYYRGEHIYEEAPNIGRNRNILLQYPEDLKIKNKRDDAFRHISEAPFRGERYCSSCSTKEHFTEMDGSNKYITGAKTVPGCTRCNRGSQEIPASSLFNSAEPIIFNEIKNDPSTCNYANDWGKAARYNLMEGYKSYHDLVSHEPNNGSQKRVWGPEAWDFMHAITFAYPHQPTERQKQAMYHFFMSLPELLPCLQCGKHCKEYLQQNPPQCASREAVSKWLVNFHNTVNKRLNKPTIPYETIKDRYSAMTCF